MLLVQQSFPLRGRDTERGRPTLTNDGIQALKQAQVVEWPEPHPRAADEVFGGNGAP